MVEVDEFEESLLLYRYEFHSGRQMSMVFIGSVGLRGDPATPGLFCVTIEYTMLWKIPSVLLRLLFFCVYVVRQLRLYCLLKLHSIKYIIKH